MVHGENVELALGTGNLNETRQPITKIVAKTREQNPREVDSRNDKS